MPYLLNWLGQAESSLGRQHTYLEVEKTSGIARVERHACPGQTIVPRCLRIASGEDESNNLAYRTGAVVVILG